MYYGNLNALGRNFMGSRIDPNAKAYIAAVVAAGGLVDATQTAAINTFYESAKADGYYTSLKRLYLPIWGVAAANAIDMITLAAGTFVGGVTHAAGYVQGNGSTGYFNTGVAPSDIFLTTSGGGFFLTHIAGTADNKALFGSSDVTITNSFFSVDTTAATGNVFEWTTSGTGGRLISTGVFKQRGIVSHNVSGTNQRTRLRVSSGISVNTTESTSGLASLTTRPVYFIGRNNNGTLDVANNCALGVMGLCSGMSDAADSSMTLALKGLWETASGLTLA